MYWFYAAFIAAICFTIVSVIGKKVMQKTSSLTFTTIYTLIGTFVYIPIFIYYFQKLGLSFSPRAGVAMLVSGIGNTLGILALNTSIKRGELSVAVPLNKLQPVFTALIGFLALSEKLVLTEILGVVAVTLGGYIILLRDTGLLEPVRQLKNRTPQLAVFSGFAMASAAVADRFATQQIPPKLYLFFIFTFMSLGFSIQLLRKKEATEIKERFNEYRLLYLISGNVIVAGYLMIFTALSLAAAGKVITVLQTQVLLTVLAGGYLFSEESILRKVIGSIILMAGVALTVI